MRQCRGHTTTPSSPKSFDDLFDAANDLLLDPKKCKKTHQYCLRKEDIFVFVGQLATKKADIERSSTFEEVLSIVESIGNVTDGVGQLTMYDTALRLCQPRGMNPKDVHLHRGAWDGASYLKVPDLHNNAPNERELFPKELQVLESWQIEDFLCVCKDQIRKLFP